MWRIAGPTFVMSLEGGGEGCLALLAAHQAGPQQVHQHLLTHRVRNKIFSQLFLLSRFREITTEWQICKFGNPKFVKMQNLSVILPLSHTGVKKLKI